ncbi:MAG: glutamate--tRNA ligase [Rhodothalassiaceae bacterium]
MTPVITRFAPSPTGFLHIGGARTALFNWLFARGRGGQFLLRIEDTDRKRSTDEAIAAILDGLSWLELDWDGAPVSQFSRRERHAAVAHQLLDAGLAYRCYASQEELAAMREAAQKQGRPWRYDGRWRDRDPADAPPGVDPVIRFKAPREGETVIADAVQGPVRVPNAELDDMVLLRSDGTPTYMLSVVVDDHDMQISHVIRGDDHLTNAFRQAQLYRALAWELPAFAHIPLINGPDGKKMSKRHGALGVDAYRDMGYLPKAMRNYLMRLGWGHGDMEVFSTAEAMEKFTLEGIGKGAARFDFKKLENLNGIWLRQAEDERLVILVAPFVQQRLGRPLTDADRDRLTQGMAGLKERARTLVELADNAMFYVADAPLPLTDKAAKLLDEAARSRLDRFARVLEQQDDWRQEALEQAAREFAEAEDIKLGALAQPLRAALTGSHISPSVFDVLAVLGRQESCARIRDRLA